MNQPLENKTSYDKTPYESQVISAASPSRVCAIARLFGVAAPEPKTARILELGCADGANIIEIARIYPESKCIGVDLSEVQVAKGKEKIAQLGLKNIQIIQASITDIGDSKFDYIICHGVFSWVDKEMQEKILAACRNNLNPTGVAYVSYNTMPGWAGALAARDMMKYHTAGISGDVALQARTLLEFIRSGQENKTPYSEMINAELEFLAGQPDHYLIHEHLEEHNTPYYFHQFNEMAEQHNLQYLSEIKLPTMFIGNLPKKIADILATSTDIIRTEQYMDFIYNRRFRSTLLCHKNQILDRNISTGILADLYFINNFKSNDYLSEYDYKNIQKFTFTTADGVTLETDDKLVIAMLVAFSKFDNKPTSPQKITDAILEIFAEKNLKIKEGEKELLPLVLTNLIKLIFTGGISVQADDSTIA